MERLTFILFGILVVGVITLIIIATLASVATPALTMGFGALFGLCSIAFTQHLNARAAFMKREKERLQDARGLARALASEIGIFGHVIMVKGHTLQLEIRGDGDTNDSVDPEDLLRFVELPSRAIFDANANKIPLLEVIEEFGEFSEGEEKLVERVVGFYEGIVDFRSDMSSAKLQNRRMTLKELNQFQDQLKSTAEFALVLSNRLHEFIRFSEPSKKVSKSNTPNKANAADAKSRVAD